MKSPPESFERRIAIAGTGFVAQSYLRALHHLGHHPLVLSRAWLDYTDPKALRKCLQSHSTSVLINASGYTGRTVDDCEVNQTECVQANVTTPVMMATVCKELLVTMIQVSSGCLFDGPGPFRETDERSFADGRQFYAQCKARAEDGILESGVSAFLFRIRMPFSHIPHPRNLLMKLAKYETILDGTNSVTWLDEFSYRSWELYEWNAPPGTYHCVQPQPVSIACVAEMLNQAGLRQHPLKLFDKKTFLSTHAPRSAAVLDSSKFETAYNAPFTPSDMALRWCISQLQHV